MRIYIPAMGVDIGRDALLPRTVHTVTNELRDFLPGDVEEVLEAVVMNVATDESLRVLAALAISGETVYPLRVVIAAEIEEKKIAHAEGEDTLPTALQLVELVGREDVVSFHVDDAKTANDVVLAVGGDAAALERVTDDEDLMWFDVEERGRLIEYFGWIESVGRRPKSDNRAADKARRFRMRRLAACLADAVSSCLSLTRWNRLCSRTSIQLCSRY